MNQHQDTEQPHSDFSRDIRADFSGLDAVVVIGAGPSLDYCMEFIEANLDRAMFVLTDRVAAGFIRKWPKSQRVVVTVEQRRHAYIVPLHGEIIFHHCQVPEANLRSENKYIPFAFDFDNRPDLMRLVSPGTVAGTAISLSLYMALRDEWPRELTLTGVDLAYPDSQVYCRLAAGSMHTCNRFRNRENQEFTASLLKGTRIAMAEGYILRTSEEFLRSREGILRLLNSAAEAGFRISGLSPCFMSRALHFF